MPKQRVIEPGEIYYKVDAPSTLWVVHRVLDLPEGPHIQLRQMDHPRRSLTVSAVALLDKRMFKQGETAA